MLFFNIKKIVAASTLLVFAGLSSASYAAESDLPPPVEPGFYWTDWLNRDRALGTGDWELASLFSPELLCEYPLDIQAKTGDNQIYSPLDETPDVLQRFDPVVGLVCRNADQQGGWCSEYKVRFMCQVGDWTGWLNADRPTLTGDWETLDSNDNTTRCENPTDIRARVVGTTAVISNIASAPDDLAAFGLTGLACINADQADGTCEDYEIRFLCPSGWNEAPSDEIDVTKFTDPALRSCVAATGITKISELTGLRCTSKDITDASGIEQLTALTYLRLDKNQLTAIDVSANTALTHLDLSNNQLTSIDVSANTALFRLDLQSNKLTSLDIPTEFGITYLFIKSNFIPCSQVQELNDAIFLVSNDRCVDYLPPPFLPAA